MTGAVPGPSLDDPPVTPIVTLTIGPHTVTQPVINGDESRARMEATRLWAAKLSPEELDQMVSLIKEHVAELELTKDTHAR